MMQPTSLRIVQRTSFETMNCSVAQCLEVVGEWWSMLIIRDAFLGVRRFDDFQVTPGHLPQHPQRAPDHPGRGRCPRTGALPATPSAPRVSPQRQRSRPLAGPHHHARVGRQMGSAQRRPPRSRARRVRRGHAPQTHLQRLRPARRPTLTPPSARTRSDAQRLRPDHAGVADLSAAQPGGHPITASANNGPTRRLPPGPGAGHRDGARVGRHDRRGSGHGSFSAAAISRSAQGGVVVAGRRAPG